MLFSFNVTNENDAKKCLQRFGVPAGWYVVREKKTLKVLINKKIYSMDY